MNKNCLLALFKCKKVIEKSSSVNQKGNEKTLLNKSGNLKGLKFMTGGKLRSSHPEVFLRKAVLKICSKFTGEHPCRSVISIKLQSNFIEIALQHGCSPVNLLHISRTPFPRNTSEWLLLKAL